MSTTCTELCFLLPVSQKPGRDHLYHLISLHPATLCFSGLSFVFPSSVPTPFLSSHQASRSRSVDPNLCSSLEHKVTQCSTCPPAPPTPPAELSTLLCDVRFSVQHVTETSCDVAFPVFRPVHRDYVKGKTCHIPHSAIHFLSTRICTSQPRG